MARENIGVVYKDQLISKGLFNVIVWTKKNNGWVSALAFKKRLDQKDRGILYHYLGSI